MLFSQAEKDRMWTSIHHLWKQDQQQLIKSGIQKQFITEEMTN